MFIIIARRTAGSMFGEATAPCKDHEGNVMRFLTKDAAQEKANEWTSRMSSTNVHYHVEEENG